MIRQALEIVLQHLTITDGPGWSPLALSTRLSSIEEELTTRLNAAISSLPLIQTIGIHSVAPSIQFLYDELAEGVDILELLRPYSITMVRLRVVLILM